jgi:inosine-uridine nucleoside N-ribohydrolase
MDGREGIGFLDLPYDGPEATILDMPASEWLVAQAEREPFHLVGIGPLTNIATFLRHASSPRFRLLSLSVMGGLLELRTQPLAWQRDVAERGAVAWPDYNTVCDPDAAFTVATEGPPITWIPLDATVRAALRSHHLARLPRSHPLGTALGRSIDAWRSSQFASLFDGSVDPAPIPADAVALLHDPLTVASLIGGDWLTLRQTHLKASLSENGFRLREDESGAPATVADAVNGDAFAAFCLDRMLRLLD